MTRVGLKKPSLSWLSLGITNHIGPSKESQEGNTKAKTFQKPR